MHTAAAYTECLFTIWHFKICRTSLLLNATVWNFHASLYTQQNLFAAIGNTFLFLFFIIISGRWSPYWVHAALRPLLGLLYLSWMIVRMEKLVEWNGFGRGNRSTQRKPAPTPFCPPQIPLARPGHEPGPPRWEASD
jgi:hypothetical protein